MNYGYHIEQVEGGWIVTFAERDFSGAMGALQSSVRTTKYVFKDVEELLAFLKGRLTIGIVKQVTK